MKVTAVKTRKIVAGDDLFEIFDGSLKDFGECQVLAVASNIVSLCEGRVVRIGERDKDELVVDEAEYYLPPNNKYQLNLTIKNNILGVNAGIDESNTGGYFTLWPENPQESANKIREYLMKRFGVKHAGTVITDSKTTPLRWGVTGVALSHSGFEALNDYIGKPDIFGRVFKFEKANVADSLATAAVVVTGEGDEQTPLAVIEDLPFVNFQKRNPSREEIEMLKISIDEDVYGEILRRIEWKIGRDTRRK
jgi:putative folate metabolism gamma-glutamate ligase